MFENGTMGVEEDTIIHSTVRYKMLEWWAGQTSRIQNIRVVGRSDREPEKHTDTDTSTLGAHDTFGAKS